MYVSAKLLEQKFTSTPGYTAYAYLTDNVFAMGYWLHSSQELQKYNPKAIDITLVCQLMSHKIFWINVSLEARCQL